MKNTFVIVASLFLFGCSSLPDHQRALDTYNYQARDSSPIGDVIPVREELVTDEFVKYQERYKSEHNHENCSSREACVSVIKARIVQRWNLPTSFNGGDNMATFSLYISAEGILTSLVLESSTGDIAFNFSCKEAVIRSSPFPNFSNPEISGWNSEEKITIVFGPVR